MQAKSYVFCTIIWDIRLKCGRDEVKEMWIRDGDGDKGLEGNRIIHVEITIISLSELCTLHKISNKMSP